MDATRQSGTSGSESSDGGAAGGRDAAPGKVTRSERAYGGAGGSGGSPLGEVQRARFESSLGTDLSEVRVHTGADSAHAAGDLGARAFATGQDIHFGAGQYRPDDPFGLHLLAHEVAHTVQQGGGGAAAQAKLEVSEPGDHAERQADRAADAMVAGERVAIDRGGAPRIARQPAEASGAAATASPAASNPVFVDFKRDWTWDPQVILDNLHRFGAVPAAMEAAIRDGVRMTAVYCIDLRSTASMAGSADPSRKDHFDQIVFALNSRINELTYATTRSPQTYEQLAQVARWSEELAPAAAGPAAQADKPAEPQATGGTDPIDAYAAQLAARDGYRVPAAGNHSATRQPGTIANTTVGGDSAEASAIPGWRFVRDPFDNTVTAIDEAKQTGIQYAYRAVTDEAGTHLELDHKEELTEVRVAMLARMDKSALGESQEGETGRKNRMDADAKATAADRATWTAASPANAKAAADYQQKLADYMAAVAAKQKLPPVPMPPPGYPGDHHTTACNLWPTDVYRGAGGSYSDGFPFTAPKSWASWRGWKEHASEGPKPGDVLYFWDIMQNQAAHMSVFKSKTAAGDDLESWAVSEGGQGNYNEIQQVREGTMATFNTKTGVFSTDHATEGKKPLDRSLVGWIDVAAYRAEHPVSAST